MRFENLLTILILFTTVRLSTGQHEIFALSQVNGSPTGSFSMKVFGIHFRDDTLSVRIGATSSESSMWLDQSSVLAKASTGFGNSMSVILSQMDQATLSNSFTFDGASAVGLFPGNSTVPATGGVSLTVVASGIGAAAATSFTGAVRIGGSGSEASVWASSSSVLAKAGAGQMDKADVVVTSPRALAVSTLSHALSYSAASVQGVVSGTVPATGGVSLTVVVLAVNCRSPATRLGQTSSEGTYWISSTTLNAKAEFGLSASVTLVVTASVFKEQSLSGVLSYDISGPLPSVVSSLNLPNTGSVSITARGSGFVSVDRSIVARIGNSASSATSWISSSSLHSKPPSGLGASVSIVLTFSASFGSLTGTLSYDGVEAVLPFNTSLNTPCSGSFFITLTTIGGLPVYDSSSLIRLGVSAAENSIWKSDSSVCLKYPAGYGSTESVSTTVFVIVQTSWFGLSYNLPLISSAVGSPVPNTGSMSITLSGSQFPKPGDYFGDNSLALRNLRTSLEAVEWCSTSSLRTKTGLSDYGVSFPVIASLIGVSTAQSIFVGSLPTTVLCFSDPASRQPTGLNSPTTGSLSVYIAYVSSVFDDSKLFRAGGSAALATSWLSDSTFAIKTPAGQGDRQSNILTVPGQNSTTFTNAFSYSSTILSPIYPYTWDIYYPQAIDIPAVPPTGAISITVWGSNLAQSDRSPTVRIGGSSPLSCSWISDSALQVKPSAGDTLAATAVTTVSPSRDLSSTSRLISYDIVSPYSNYFSKPSISNLPNSGSVSISLTGQLSSGFPITSRARMFGTAAEATLWISYSALNFKNSPGKYVPQFAAFDVTATRNKRVLSNSSVTLTYDVACLTRASPANIPSTASISISIIGISFSKIAFTQRLRFGGTAAACSKWVSESSVTAKTNRGMHNVENGRSVVLSVGSFAVPTTLSFAVSYTTPYCTNGSVVIIPNGVSGLIDNSNAFAPYPRNLTCSWIVTLNSSASPYGSSCWSPPHALDFTFPLWALNSNDFVEFYDLNSTTGTETSLIKKVLATDGNTTVPVTSAWVEQPTVLIRFTSTGSGTVGSKDTGFKVKWAIHSDCASTQKRVAKCSTPMSCCPDVASFSAGVTCPSGCNTSAGLSFSNVERLEFTNTTLLCASAATSSMYDAPAGGKTGIRLSVKDTNIYTFEGVCGNSKVTAPEQCDDGNNVAGDGCSATCEIEQCFGRKTFTNPSGVLDDGVRFSGEDPNMMTDLSCEFLVVPPPNASLSCFPTVRVKLAWSGSIQLGTGILRIYDYNITTDSVISLLKTFTGTTSNPDTVYSSRSTAPALLVTLTTGSGTLGTGFSSRYSIDTACASSLSTVSFRDEVPVFCSTTALCCDEGRDLTLFQTPFFTLCPSNCANDTQFVSVIDRKPGSGVSVNSSLCISGLRSGFVSNQLQFAPYESSPGIVTGILPKDVCGNGILSRVNGEECDDGNNSPFDGCSADCKLEQCSGVTTLTNETGVFSQNPNISSSSNYQKNLHCGWIIQPSVDLITDNWCWSTWRIRLVVNASIPLESDDYVKVFDSNATSSRVLFTSVGASEVSTYQIVYSTRASTPILYVEFFSGSDDLTDRGIVISYTIDRSCHTEDTLASRFKETDYTVIPVRNSTDYMTATCITTFSCCNDFDGVGTAFMISCPAYCSSYQNNYPSEPPYCSWNGNSFSTPRTNFFRASDLLCQSGIDAGMMGYCGSEVNIIPIAYNVTSTIPGPTTTTTETTTTTLVATTIAADSSSDDSDDNGLSAPLSTSAVSSSDFSSTYPGSSGDATTTSVSDESTTAAPDETTTAVPTVTKTVYGFKAAGVCGNSFRSADESCDDGGLSSYAYTNGLAQFDGCSSSCKTDNSFYFRYSSLSGSFYDISGPYSKYYGSGGTYVTTFTYEISPDMSLVDQAFAQCDTWYIRLVFNSFDVADSDLLTVSDISTSTTRQILKVSGSSIPAVTFSLRSTNPKLSLIWEFKNAAGYGGWGVSYTVERSCVENPVFSSCLSTFSCCTSTYQDQPTSNFKVTCPKGCAASTVAATSLPRTPFDYDTPFCSSAASLGTISTTVAQVSSLDINDPDFYYVNDLCGNGKIGPTEKCDDGNTTPYDGCSPTCVVEASSYTYTGLSGSLSDGSGTGVNYNYNMKWSYFIQPAIASTVLGGCWKKLSMSVSFSLFTLERNTYLKVFNGSTTTAVSPNIYSYTQTVSPPVTGAAAFVISHSATPVVSLLFASSSNVAEGWTATYSVSKEHQSAALCTTKMRCLTANLATVPTDGITYEIICPACTNTSEVVYAEDTIGDFFDASSNICASAHAAESIDLTVGGATEIFAYTNSETGSVEYVVKDVCGNGFKSPSEECDDGNLLPYDSCSPQCKLILDSRTYTDLKGTFYDGSTTGANYKSNLDLRWVITPNVSLAPNCWPTTRLEITFQSFDIDLTDSVLIYDGTEEDDTQLLAELSGSALPPAVHSSYSESPSLYIIFSTDSSAEKSGFGATWKLDNTCDSPGSTLEPTCGATLLACCDLPTNTTSYSLNCPSGCSNTASTTNSFSYSTPFCSAGINKGVVNVTDGGPLSVKVTPGNTTAAGRFKIVGTCGNGKLELDEECDDGNTLPFDDCSPTCTRSEEKSFSDATSLKSALASAKSGDKFVLSAGPGRRLLSNSLIDAFYLCGTTITVDMSLEVRGTYATLNCSGQAAITVASTVRYFSMKGFQIVNSGGSGAVIITNVKSVTISDCIFTGNVVTRSVSAAGAILISQTDTEAMTLTITNTVFTNNTARSSGVRSSASGAVLVIHEAADSGSVYTISGCTFQSNTAFVTSTATSVDSSQFFSVAAGALAVHHVGRSTGSTLLVNATTFTSNTASSTAFAFGATSGAIAWFGSQSATRPKITFLNINAVSNVASHSATSISGSSAGAIVVAFCSNTIGVAMSLISSTFRLCQSSAKVASQGSSSGGVAVHVYGSTTSLSLDASSSSFTSCSSSISTSNATVGSTRVGAWQTSAGGISVSMFDTVNTASLSMSTSTFSSNVASVSAEAFLACAGAALLAGPAGSNFAAGTMSVLGGSATANTASMTPGGQSGSSGAFLFFSNGATTSKPVLTVTNSTLSNNLASSSPTSVTAGSWGGGCGGAVGLVMLQGVSMASVLVQNTVATRNTASVRASALGSTVVSGFFSFVAKSSLSDSTFTITLSTISSNSFSSLESLGYGSGGVAAFAGSTSNVSVVVSSSTFTFNHGAMSSSSSASSCGGSLMLYVVASGLALSSILTSNTWASSSCSQTSLGFLGAGSASITVLSKSTSTVSLSGNNWTNSSAGSGVGAFYLNAGDSFGSASVSLQQETFTSCSGSYSGAYLVFGNASQSVSVRNSTFLSNLGTLHGSLAISSTAQSPITLNSLSFTSNRGPAYGGGFSAPLSGQTSMTNCNFFNNTATTGGGAYFRQRPLLLSSTVFSSNVAIKEGGGAALLESSQDGRTESSTITLITVTSNRAQIGGGLALSFAGGGSLAITSSVLSGNTASYSLAATTTASYSGSGGGLAVVMQITSSLALSLNNLTVLNNTASAGGGVFTYSICSENTIPLSGVVHTVSVDSCLFSGNSIVSTLGDGTSVPIVSPLQLGAGGGLYILQQQLQTQPINVFPTAQFLTTISQSRFQYNAGIFGGGASLQAELTATDAGSGWGTVSWSLTGLTFYANTAVKPSSISAVTYSGGAGLSVYPCTISRCSAMTVTSTTFTQNQAVLLEGGAAYFQYRNIQLTDVILKSNSAGSSAGGLRILVQNNWQVTITNPLAIGNSALGMGGAIHVSSVSDSNAGGTVQITQTRFDGSAGFSQNSALPGSAVTSCNGGAISSFTGAKMILTALSLVSNYAAAGGGALYAADSTLQIVGVICNANTAADGGCLYAEGSSVKVTSTMFCFSTACHVSRGFRYNVATRRGGAMYLANGNFNFDDATYEGNLATKDGGAIYLNSAVAYFTNSLYTANRANNSGGVFYSSSSFLTVSKDGCRPQSFTDCSSIGLISNIAELEGGSIYVTAADSPSPSLSLTMTDTIITNNLAKGLGGGISVAALAEVSLQTVSFVTNVASFFGGAISVSGSPSISGSFVTISRNTAASGAGVYMTSDIGTLSFSDSSFLSNRATSTDGAACYIIGDRTSLVYSSTLAVSMTNCLFDSNRAAGGGGGIYFGAYVTGTLTSSTFSNNTGETGSGGAVSMATSSSVSISNSTLVQSSAPAGGAIYVASAAALVVQYSNISSSVAFTSNLAVALGGGAICADGTLTTIACTFADNVAQKGGAINVGATGVFSDAASSFISNSALGLNGGAVNTNGGTSSSLVVTGSSFKSNSAGISGGAVSIGDGSTHIITQSGFNMNSAGQSGGAIFLTTAFVNRTLKSDSWGGNNFTYNSAKLAGGSVYWQAQLESYTSVSGTQYRILDTPIGPGPNIAPFCSPDCSFRNNTSPYGPNFATQISRITATLNTSQPMESGSSLPEITVQVRDFYGQLAVGGKTVVITARPISPANSTSEAVILSGGLTTSSDTFATALMSTVKMTARPNRTHSLEFVADSVVGTSLSVFLRVCIPGEYFDSTSVRCQTCSERQISTEYMATGCRTCQDLATNNENHTICNCQTNYFTHPNTGLCDACPTGASCESGNIYVQNGYWMRDFSVYKQKNLNSSVKVFSCSDNRGACTTTNESDTFASARANVGGNSLCKCDDSACYIGPLCSACPVGYGRTATFCIKCQESNLESIFLVGMILAVVSAICLLIWNGVRSASSGKSEFNTCIRVMLSYVQVVSLIGGFRADLPDDLRKFFKNQEAATSPSFQLSPVDCAAGYNFYQKLILYLILPPLAFIIPFFLFVIRYYIVRLFRSRREYAELRKKCTNDYVTTLLVTMFLIHPTVSKQVFSVFACRKIDDDYSFLIADVSIQCYVGAHNSWTLVALAFSLIYVLGIPLVQWGILYRNRADLHNPNGKTNHLRFLYDGYEKEFWYWEFVIVGRKIMFVIATVFFTALDPSVQVLLALDIVVLAAGLQIYGQPYDSDALDALENVCLIGSALTLNCAIFFGIYTTTEMSSGIVKFLVAAIYLTNASVLGFFVYTILKLFYFKGKELENDPSSKLMRWRRRQTLVMHVVLTSLGLKKLPKPPPPETSEELENKYKRNNLMDDAAGEEDFIGIASVNDVEIGLDDAAKYAGVIYEAKQSDMKEISAAEPDTTAISESLYGRPLSSQKLIRPSSRK